MFNWFQMSSYWILGCEYFSWVPFQIFRYEHTWVNLCLFFFISLLILWTIFSDWSKKWIDKIYMSFIWVIGEFFNCGGILHHCNVKLMEFKWEQRLNAYPVYRAGIKNCGISEIFNAWNVLICLERNDDLIFPSLY